MYFLSSFHGLPMEHLFQVKWSLMSSFLNMLMKLLGLELLLAKVLKTHCRGVVMNRPDGAYEWAVGGFWGGFGVSNLHGARSRCDRITDVGWQARPFVMQFSEQRRPEGVAASRCHGPGPQQTSIHFYLSHLWFVVSDALSRRHPSVVQPVVLHNYFKAFTFDSCNSFLHSSSNANGHGLTVWSDQASIVYTVYIYTP